MEVSGWAGAASGRGDSVRAVGMTGGMWECQGSGDGRWQVVCVRGKGAELADKSVTSHHPRSQGDFL